MRMKFLIILAISFISISSCKHEVDLSNAPVITFSKDIQPIIVMTKSDLADPKEFLKQYGALHIPNFSTNKFSPDGELANLIAGKVSVFIGHSGVGKSTLMNTISGMVAPSSGEVIANGKTVTGPGPDRGIVFQNYSLLPWLTVYKNVFEAVDSVLPHLSKAEKVIGFDTGLTHISGAFDKPLVSIWGGTTPELLGVQPYHISNSYMASVDLPCRPCSKFGLEKCPLGHFKCMENIHTDRIVNYVNTQ